MQYFKCKWIHNFPDEPVWLYSEIDDERWEIRKVYFFRDGSKGFAAASESYGDCFLSEVPIPELAEIASEPEFEPIEISCEEFEDIWRDRAACWTPEST